MERIVKLAYRIELPNSLAEIHNGFHISQLRKRMHDPETTIALTTLKGLVVEPNMTLLDNQFVL